MVNGGLVLPRGDASDMDDAADGTSPAPPPAAPATAGNMLRSAREARGLTLDEVGARTRVPLRHLVAIEASDYPQLPSPTYAVGFAKAFARAVGADEVAVAAKVRDEVARLGRRVPEYVPYEVTDPARVPSRTVAILGIGAALALLILAGLWFGSGLMRRPGTTTSPTPSAPVVTATAPVRAPAAPPVAAPTTGQVTLAATDEVWLRVYDADNKTLFLGTMKPGDRFDVPAGANGPKINVGRPDKLQVTVNGSAVPPLGTGERPIKDVRVDAASIAARLAGAPAQPRTTAPTTPTPLAAPTPVATSTPASAPTPDRTRTPKRRSGRSARPRAPLTETQRANLASAAAAARGRQP